MRSKSAQCAHRAFTRTLRSIPFAHIVYRAFKKHSPCTHCLFSVHLSFSPSSFIFIRKLQSTFHVKNIIFIRIFLVEFKEPVYILEQVCTSRYTKKTCFCFCFFVLQYYRCMFFFNSVSWQCCTSPALTVGSECGHCLLRIHLACAHRLLTVQFGK